MAITLGGSGRIDISQTILLSLYNGPIRYFGSVYSWTLTAPTGSGTTLLAGLSATTNSLIPDRNGTYVVNVTVDAVPYVVTLSVDGGSVPLRSRNATGEITKWLGTDGPFYLLRGRRLNVPAGPGATFSTILDPTLLFYVSAGSTISPPQKANASQYPAFYAQLLDSLFP